MAGHRNISSTMKNSVQLRMTLGMWQKRKTMTMQMRTVAKLASLLPLLFAFMWVNLKKSFRLKIKIFIRYLLEVLRINIKCSLKIFLTFVLFSLFGQ